LTLNTNRTRDAWEPWGIHTNWVTAGTQDVTGVDIVLQDQPSVWGTLTYTGSATGDVHVILERIECTGTAPWSFETSTLPGYSTMALTAFRDSNTNGVADLETEAHARFLIPGMIPTEGIHLILKDPDSSGDGYPNWSSSDPGAFIDNNGNGIGDGFEPNPDVPGYWVAAYTYMDLPMTVGPHLLNPGLPTNSVLTQIEFGGSGNSGFTVEGIDNVELPGYFFDDQQYRQLTNSLADPRTGTITVYTSCANYGDVFVFPHKKPAPLILPPECNTATHVYSIQNFGICGMTPNPGISNYVAGIWLQDMVKFCSAKTGTNTSQTFAVTLGHKDDTSLTNLISTVLSLPTLTWRVGGDGGSMMATPPLPGAPYGVIMVGTNRNANTTNSAPFWAAQEIQPVVELDTAWLLVGHVDEAIMFVSSNKYLIADPWLAADLLHSEIAAGNATNETMWFGGMGTDISERTNNIAEVVIRPCEGGYRLTTLSDGGMLFDESESEIVFTNHAFQVEDILRVNNEILRVISVNGTTVTVARAQGGRPAAAHAAGDYIYALSFSMQINLPVRESETNTVFHYIQKMKNRLHSTSGNAIEAISVPVLFMGVPSWGLTAHTPNVANCLVLNNGRLIMADPGVAAFRQNIITTMSAFGFQVEMHDFWQHLHALGGNIHCATAAIRGIPEGPP